MSLTIVSRVGCSRQWKYRWRAQSRVSHSVTLIGMEMDLSGLFVVKHHRTLRCFGELVGHGVEGYTSMGLTDTQKTCRTMLAEN